MIVMGEIRSRSPNYAILDIRTSHEEIPCRLPIKFGRSVVTKALVLSVEVDVENRAGDAATGRGSMGLGSPWSFPSPAVPDEQRFAAMKQVGERYAALLGRYTAAAHPIDIWLELEPELHRIARQVGDELELAEPVPKLCAHVCASPVDAALHDAFGKVNGICAYDGYGPEFMERDLSAYLGPGFEGRYIADYLEPSYRPEIEAFHMVGGLDKLTQDELTPDDPQDGQPVSLDQWIERDGVFCLKLKLNGRDIEWDLARTRDVAQVATEALARKGIDELHLTVDFNEVCEAPEYVVEYLDRLREAQPRSYDALLYVEQPVARDLASHRFRMDDAAARKPILVDESLCSPDDIEVARELGWSGIALKACKGQSATLLCLCRAVDSGMVYAVQDSCNNGYPMIQSAGLTARTRPLKGFEYNSRQFRPAGNEPFMDEYRTLFQVRDGFVRTECIKPLGLGY